MKRTLQDYKSPIKPIWCPGCGDYGILRALQQALLDLNIAPENIVTVSGIGCSGRFSHYLNTYSLHGTHGRAVPTALGAKAARPDLTVLAIGGDGDGMGIGGGHIPHAARKNVDITYLLIDNRIYGLTKGQMSPTTPFGQKTKTSPYGVSEAPMNALAVFLAYDISFIARTASMNIPEMTQILKAAISHRGMSLVYILSPCMTFPVLKSSEIKEMVQPLPKEHDPGNKLGALELAYTERPLYTGIFYQVQKPVLETQLKQQVQAACRQLADGEPVSIKQLLKSYV
ncbi:MAG TPA: 2-oxoacid:ferredoxin oxidoreductase subunit beta [bacterium]|nr:2-oxoacid:ferredoxin oxidoreductase subunit beta [bacterium]